MEVLYKFNRRMHLETNKMLHAFFALNASPVPVQRLNAIRRQRANDVFRTPPIIILDVLRTVAHF
jgi:hypothetical protein